MVGAGSIPLGPGMPTDMLFITSKAVPVGAMNGGGAALCRWSEVGILAGASVESMAPAKP